MSGELQKLARELRDEAGDRGSVTAGVKREIAERLEALARSEFDYQVSEMYASINLGNIAEEPWLETRGIEIPTDDRYIQWLASWLIGEGWEKKK